VDISIPSAAWNPGCQDAGNSCFFIKLKSVENSKKLVISSAAGIWSGKMTKKKRYGTIRYIFFTGMSMHRSGKKYKAFLTYLAAAASAILVSCDTGEKVGPIDLPATTALVLQTNWAVVASSHLRLREGPAISSPVLATLWKGSVLEIVSKTSTKELVEEEEDFWYQIICDGLAGWVFGSNIELYDSKNRAEESSRELQR